MTALLRRIARSLNLTSEVAGTAASILGREHPLARSISLQHTLALQSLVTSFVVVLGAVGVLLHGEHAPFVLGAASAVALALLAGMAVGRQLTHDRARDLIAEGGDGVVLPAVTRERRRLATRKVREQLACSLEELLRDTQRWYRLVPSSRPLPGARCLRFAAREVAEVTAALRAEHVRVQGVALTNRLLCDGLGSPLYGGDAARLREELNRIRYLLDASGPQLVEQTSRRQAV